LKELIKVNKIQADNKSRNLAEQIGRGEKRGSFEEKLMGLFVDREESSPAEGLSRGTLHDIWRECRVERVRRSERHDELIRAYLRDFHTLHSSLLSSLIMSKQRAKANCY
jgi:hypothetical protein